MIQKFTRRDTYPAVYINYSPERQKEADEYARHLDVKINEWIDAHPEIEVLNAFIVKTDQEAWVVYKIKNSK